ncbi:MAG: replicative DNA helicase [Rhodospirillaceae bacterium]|nr:replicative DNA helicase [Rhodospirillaceae bacterium]
MDTANPGTPDYRVVPANEGAEQALLGAILVNNATLDRVGDLLEPQHFYYPAHSRIYAACLHLREKGRTADPVTLSALFDADGDLVEIGGARYLADLAAGIVSVINPREYAELIHDLHLRRELITIGEDVVNDAYRHDLDVDAAEQIRNAEERLYKLATTEDSRGGFRPFGALVGAALDAATKAMHRDTHLTGVTTGLRGLNGMLGGLQPSDLIILAGRPAMGKTALATNIAFNAARTHLEKGGREGAVVAFFSLEMSAEQLATRILADQARVPSEKIRKGSLRESDLPDLAEASHLISQIPLFVDDTAALKVQQLRTRAMRLQRQHGLGMIVVDYLQLMQPSGTQRSDNRVQEISEISRGLKMIAKDLNVPVLALSQLSRAPEQRDGNRPQLSDLRESGSIEQDADVVMFVFREAYYLGKQEPSDDDETKHREWREKMERIHNRAEIIIGKQRHGPTGICELHFEGEFTRFTDPERRYDSDE